MRMACVIVRVQVRDSEGQVRVMTIPRELAVRLIHAQENGEAAADDDDGGSGSGSGGGGDDAMMSDTPSDPPATIPVTVEDSNDDE